MPTARRIVMLAYPGCQILDVVGPLQMFAGANVTQNRPAYRIVIAAIEPGPFATNSGMRLVADASLADIAAAGFTATDTVIAAGGDNGPRLALAAEAGVSLRSLSRLFRKELNDSPSSFVERLRIDLARRALLETDAPIESIAIGRGFGSSRRMDRAFARGIAATPSEFRARFRGVRPVPTSKGETACLPSPLAS